MTPDLIRKVQNSFDRAFPVKEKLSETFYEQLFSMAPELREFLPKDVTSQRIKLSDTLAYVVQNLHRFELLEETIIGLARRHKKYGAKPEHFAPVGMALIASLKANLAGGLTEKEAEGWLAAYSLISDMIIEEMTNPTEV